MGGNGRRRAAQQRRNQQAHEQGTGLQFLQLLPFILMILLSLSSSLFSAGFGDSTPDYQNYYSLSKTYKYNTKRTTKRGIPYFVPTRYSTKASSALVQGIEASVEVEW
jgi:hypothetical protein